MKNDATLCAVSPDALTWEVLNAYVDGELAPTAAATVASSAASDPAIAARIATLTTLRAASKANAPAGRIANARPSTLQPRLALLAATILLAVGLGVWSWQSMPIGPAGTASDDHATIAARDWLSGGKILPPDHLVVVKAEADRWTLPDLSEASLRLAYISPPEAAMASRGVFAGFVGPHGCRLGLWIGTSGTGADTMPVSRDGDGLKVRAWTSDGVSYAMISRSMDGLRLDHLARLVAEMTRRDGEITPDIRVALQATDSIGQTCLS